MGQAWSKWQLGGAAAEGGNAGLPGVHRAPDLDGGFYCRSFPSVHLLVQDLSQRVHTFTLKKKVPWKDQANADTSGC